MIRLRQLFFLGLFGLGAAATACSGRQEEQTEQQPASVRPAIRPVLDVPSLIGAPVDVLMQKFGPLQPVPARLAKLPIVVLVQPDHTFNSVGTFQRGALVVVVTYSYRTRQVSDLLLLGTDEQRLMELGQLQASAPNYLLLPVFNPQSPAQLLGLRVVPTFSPSVSTQ